MISCKSRDLKHHRNNAQHDTFVEGPCPLYIPFTSAQLHNNIKGQLEVIFYPPNQETKMTKGYTN